MSLFRVSAMFATSLFLFSTFEISQYPAEAQGLTRYGMWGDNVRRRPSPPPGSNQYNPPPGTLFGDPSGLGAYPFALEPPRHQRRRKPIELAEGGARPDIEPQKPDTVAFASDEFKPGDIVIDTSRRKLYLLLAPTGALAYPIAVGKRGFAWTGVEKVTHVTDWPDWHPPEEMRDRDPRLPLKMTGGVKNPLGAKAIYLGETLYRIHGTNARWSIGRAASSGCFRMLNGHVVHLANLIDTNTTVHVINRLPKGVVADVKRKRKWKSRSGNSRRKRYRRRRANST